MVAEGYKDTEIGVIPVEWEVMKLDDMSMIITKGTTPTTLGFNYQESGINFIKVESIDKNGHFDKTKFAYISEEANTCLKRSIIKENDLLISIAGALGRVAIVSKDIIPANTNQALSIIRLKDDYVKKYIYFYLNSSQIQTHIDKINVQNAQANLSLQNIKNFKIPLPPLKEQEKIADILSTADAKIDAIAIQIDKAETLKKGLLQKLLSKGIGHSKFKESEIGKIPDSWKAVELNDVSDITRLAGYEYSEYWEEKPKGDILALKGYNIGKGKIINRDTFYISNKLSQQLVRSKLFIGDVVFPVVGTIGNAVAITENNKYHINQNIAKITPYLVLNSDYLVQFLMSVKCSKEINRLSATTSQPNVLVGSLRKFRLPLPPLEEQKQIADILSTVDEKLEVLRAKKEKYETLKKGLLQKLLSGEVRV
jgi:type I restriction enzyme S subunit